MKIARDYDTSKRDEDSLTFFQQLAIWSGVFIASCFLITQVKDGVSSTAALESLNHQNESHKDVDPASAAPNELDQLYSEIVAKKTRELSEAGTSDQLAAIRGEIAGFTLRESYRLAIKQAVWNKDQHINRTMDSCVDEYARQSWAYNGKPFGISAYCDSYYNGFQKTQSFLLMPPEEQLRKWSQEKQDIQHAKAESDSNLEKLKADARRLEQKKEVMEQATISKAFSPGGAVHLLKAFKVHNSSTIVDLPASTPLTVVEVFADQMCKVAYRPNPYREVVFLIHRSQLGH